MDAQEIPKAYNAKDWEDKLYARWEESGFFNPDKCIEAGVTKTDATPFSVLMPPPNVTGVLHLGHAMENSIMDTIARYKRMRGFRTLFLPGADHAAVATQARVEKNLMEQDGYTNPRQELGREKLLEKIRAYADESKTTIIKQVRAMGSSADWSRFAYTFDDERILAVNTIFQKMYADGLIYKGYRVVNWSPKGRSTCSDDELVHIERPATLYTFRYANDFPISIATTRPETKLGDTAVAVHPSDKRYKKYIGKTFTVDIGAIEPLQIKIIGDENIDPDFGTGAVGITPAHSQTDFEMYERHGGIKLIPIIGRDGNMTENAGKAYMHLPALEAREKFVTWLRKNNLLEKEEATVQNVGTSDRFGDVVEILPMHQWFVAVNKKIPGRGKSLKDLMRDAVTTGLDNDPEKKVSIQPERFTKTYLHWIDNLRDWCISRQIWWGHRIPIWYRDKEVYCGIETPKGDNWEQDPDTLDTWFSSGLWTFSTLGWPEKNTTDLPTYHPTSFMQMGHELLFFWMARMILMTAYTLETIPFHDVYIHGILRDKNGKKFSKSLGNGIDPIDVSQEYGTDALRLALLSDVTPGNDSRFSSDKVEQARNFVNKLWNIARYILSASTATKEKPVAQSLADHWILQRLHSTIHTTETLLDNYHFSRAIHELRAFTWDEFADWYVEIHKVEKNDAVLRFVLDALLKLWHPFTPFVTEALFQTASEEKNSLLLMAQKWPDEDFLFDKKQAALFDATQKLIVGIRNARSIYHIDPIKEITLSVQETSSSLLLQNEALFKRLARIHTIQIIKKDAPEQCVFIQTGKLQAYIHLEGLIDIDKERTRLEKESEFAKQYIASIKKRLSDKNFTDQAPAHVREQNEVALRETENKATDLSHALKNLL